MPTGHPKGKKRKPGCPLYLHRTGQWAKKIRGRTYYFGVGEAEAVKEYLRVRDDLEAGRKPRPAAAQTATMAELANAFLTAKRQRVDTGEMTPGMWAEYHRAAERAVDTFGPKRLVADLRPDDFGHLRAAVARKLGPAALAKFITMTRTLFTYAYDVEMIDVPVRFGSQFEKPPRRVMRLTRATKGAKLIDAPAIWKLLDHAGEQMRAMILLGLNCGFGQTDCSNLTRQTLGIRPGWIDAPRVKSGIARRCPLWPETIQALEAVHPIRPDPKDPADADQVFVTLQGNRWVCYRDPGDGRRGHNLDAVARQFAAVCRAAGVTVPGGFYVLRHTFRTVADEVKDQPAAMLVMGHADHTISGTYRESVSDERLLAVTDHVRAWLLAGRPTPDSDSPPPPTPAIKCDLRAGG